MQPDKDRISTLYDGTIQIKFVDSNHSYWIRHLSSSSHTGWTGWKRVSGSTTLIGILDKSGALVGWATKIANRFLKAILLNRVINIYDLDEAHQLHKVKKETSATSGSLVHDWIESYTKGYNPPEPDQPAVLNGVNAFREWMKQENVHIVGSETLIYSKEHDYCGQADFIFYKDNPTELYLGDYKTSTGLYSGVLMQTASYLRAIEEMGFQGVEWTDKKWLNDINPAHCKFVGRYALRLEKRTEAEFEFDMEEKGLMDIPYQTFEYVNLDQEPGMIEEDFQAFLYATGLYRWNYKANIRLKEYREALKE